ncbi:MAG: hypothetical protein WCH01_18325 [Methylococcaceae bacterium]
MQIFDNVKSGRLGVAAAWLKQHGSNKEQIEEVLHKMKSRIFDDIKPTKVEPAYYEMLKALNTKIEGLAQSG